ncbi:histone H1.10 [Microcebus murinus]|uniref:histone H1.10 n=1 Tax=Microcebus murinus TaxID=30608 RepID=UPI003F6B2FBF
MSVELEEALPPTAGEGGLPGKASRGAGSGGPASKGSSSSSKKKKKKTKKKNQPGKYSRLVVETIRRLAERGGSSLARVYAEARKVPWFDQQNGRTYLKYSIRALVQNDTLLQVKGTGANGSFKLNRKKVEAGGGGCGVGGEAPGAPKQKKKKAAEKEAASSSSSSLRRGKQRQPAPAGRLSHTRKNSKDKGGRASAAKVKKAAKPSLLPKVHKGRK